MENDKYNTTDLVQTAVDQQPVEFKDIFQDIMLDKISAAVDDVKAQMAQSLFVPYSDDVEDDEEYDIEDEEYFNQEVEDPDE